jgi:hypothetical protein
MECINCGIELHEAPTELGHTDCSVWKNNDIAFNGKICFDCIKILYSMMIRIENEEKITKRYKNSLEG